MTGPVATALMRRSGGMGDRDTASANALRAGLLGSGTIDEILGHRAHLPGYTEIGKLAIAAAILEAEANSPLARLHENREAALAGLSQVRSSWIATLLRRAIGPLAEDRVGNAFENVEFVVFNYDRCLERYLYFHFRYIINLSEEISVELISKIKIHHVFGSLGDGVHSERCIVPYGQLINLGRCAASIRTFTEEDTSEQANQILAAVDRAEQIVFIGFGFAPSNIDRLFRLESPAPVYATTFGMSDLALKQLQQRIGKFHGVDGAAVDLWSAFGHEIFS